MTDQSTMASSDVSVDAFTKKRFVCDTASNMGKKELVDIYYFLKKQNLEDKFFNKVSNGMKINLDLIPESTLNALYGYVKFMADTQLQSQC
jgi:hypothetical protein